MCADDVTVLQNKIIAFVLKNICDNSAAFLNLDAETVRACRGSEVFIINNNIIRAAFCVHVHRNFRAFINNFSIVPHLTKNCWAVFIDSDSRAVEVVIWNYRAIDFRQTD